VPAVEPLDQVGVLLNPRPRKRDGSGDLPNKGRACKIYTLMPDGWKMLHQPGTMQYPVGT
jgi:hypothetical protein